MEEDINFQEKNIKRKVVKKNTFHEKDNKFILKKSFEKSMKPPKIRCYSTKLVRDFVPRIKPKKSFCKPTFFQLNENETKTDDENDNKYELDAISSCEEVDDESIKSSSLSSSGDERNEEKEEKNDITKFSLEGNNTNFEQKIYNEDFSLNQKKDEDDVSSSSDEYKNLAFKKKKSKKLCEDKDNLNTFRKEMTKIKNTKVENKSKEMEINIHQTFKEEFNFGANHINNCFNDENNNKKSNDMHKKLNKLRQNSNNFSILDILSIKNGQN